MTLLQLGATGLVGRHVLSLALADPRVATVVAPTRRSMPEHPRLTAPRVDFDSLPKQADWWKADALICTLGITLGSVGSREAFWRVDHDYPLAVARLARAQGTPVYVLNSAIGANVRSRFFYNRVKGMLEQDLIAEGFKSLTLARPGVISGHRYEFHLGERLLTLGLTAVGPLLPKRLRLNPAAHSINDFTLSRRKPCPWLNTTPS